MSKKIAFIRRGRVPLVSEKIAAELQKKFPQYEVETFDITAIIKSKKSLFIANAFHTIKEYGPKVLLGKAKFRNYFFRTTYLFKQIKALMAQRLNRTDYKFSFQMQSLFDASIQGLPHVIYTDHTALANLDYPGFDKRSFYSDDWLKLEQTIYRNATLIFTRSNNITHSVVEKYNCPAYKVICVYAGSNATITDHDERDYTNKNILFVGLDWERKGGPQLAEAFKTVLQRHPDAQLTIVGCSPTIDLPNCNIMGAVPLEEVSSFYQKAAIFCLPTKLEPFGIVFIEAMSYKLPVVATNIGAIPDFIMNNQNGYLVEPNNVQQLATALIDLLDNPKKCQAFGERSYEVVTEKYTWENTGALIEENIDWMLEKLKMKSVTFSSNSPELKALRATYHATKANDLSK
jgi:glycosyltransferase involved in cell wall biosynthesis